MSLENEGYSHKNKKFYASRSQSRTLLAPYVSLTPLPKRVFSCAKRRRTERATRPPNLKRAIAECASGISEWYQGVSYFIMSVNISVEQFDRTSLTRTRP